MIKELMEAAWNEDTQRIGSLFCNVKYKVSWRETFTAMKLTVATFLRISEN